jgi:A/G-specific adenine glycosylase
MTQSARIQARLTRHESRTKEFRRLLLRWFRREGRSFPWRAPSTSHYALVVSEVLLQRTRAETVAKFFPRFIKQFPGWNHLAAATEDELRTFLEPIGLWRRRAASLRALADEMQARRGRFPTTREEVEALPGVGQYIASAVMLFCHDGREPLLDVNMSRVLERCFAPRKLADIRYDPWLQALARFVVDHPKSREINWAILDLAATNCLARKPLCDTCPLRKCCRHASTRRQKL